MANSNVLPISLLDFLSFDYAHCWACQYQTSCRALFSRFLRKHYFLAIFRRRHYPKSLTHDHRQYLHPSYVPKIVHRALFWRNMESHCRRPLPGYRQNLRRLRSHPHFLGLGYHLNSRLLPLLCRVKGSILGAPWTLGTRSRTPGFQRLAFFQSSSPIIYLLYHRCSLPGRF